MGLADRQAEIMALQARQLQATLRWDNERREAERAALEIKKEKEAPIKAQITLKILPYFHALGVKDSLGEIAKKLLSPSVPDEPLLPEEPYPFIRTISRLGVKKTLYALDFELSWNVQEPDKTTYSSTQRRGFDNGLMRVRTSETTPGKLEPQQLGVVIWYEDPSKLRILEYSSGGMRYAQMEYGERSQYSRPLSDNLAEERVKSERSLVKLTLSSWRLMGMSAQPKF